MIQTAEQFRRGKVFKTSTDFASAYGKYIAIELTKKILLEKEENANFVNVVSQKKIEQTSEEIINQIKQ